MMDLPNDLLAQARDACDDSYRIIGVARQLASLNILIIAAGAKALDESRVLLRSRERKLQGRSPQPWGGMLGSDPAKQCQYPSLERLLRLPTSCSQSEPFLMRGESA